MYYPYLILITLGLCCAYIGLFYFYPYFFRQSRTLPGLSSIYSLAGIIALSIMAYIVSFSIHDKQLSNRVLHAFAGGFTAFAVNFLAARDAKVEIGRMRFFIFAILIVTAMGVGNELIEFFLQKYYHFIFSPTVYDTWLDLFSNLIGTLIAGMVFNPFVKRHGH